MRSRTKTLVCLSMAAVLLVPAWAADPATSPASPAPAATTPADIAKLKAQLDQQQKQIEQLLAALAAQRTMLDQAGMATPAADPVQQHITPADRLIASTTPMALPPLPAPAPIPAPMASPAPAQAQAAAPSEASSPLQLKLGNVTIMPVGFMDFTTFWRDKDAASSMGTNFGSVPYNNAVQGNLSEFHFSNQNSRLGFRVDGNWKGAHFIGYNEFDFNGTSGSTSLAVSNGAIVPRLRLYWLDVRKGSIEFLAGQSWSMMTPNRKGLSALPSDLFYSQVVDINYIAGLTWTRQPGLRVLFHGPQDKVNFGISVEQADQYVGGSGGGGAITLPSALAGLVPTQVDSAGNISGAAFLQSPTLTPDIIAKVIRSELALALRSRRHPEQLQDVLARGAVVAPHHDRRGDDIRPQCGDHEKCPLRRLGTVEQR